jgi:hypothetical protein
MLEKIMRQKVPLLLLSSLILLALPATTDASLRAVRVDGFGNWSLGEPAPPSALADFTLPSALCPGWQAGSTRVQWSGYVFSGRDLPIHLTDTYCQVPVPDSLTEASYFHTDETGLASLIGSNENNRVTAIRYSYLDRNRFDFEQPATGFQWTFFRFKAGDHETMIVGLYGLAGVALGHTSYLSSGNVRLWDAGVDDFDGQYFCFANGDYIGEWNGVVAGGSPCVLSAQRIFRGAFE